MQAMMPVPGMAQEQAFKQTDNPMTGAWINGASWTKTIATPRPARFHTQLRMMPSPMKHAIPASQETAGLAAARIARWTVHIRLGMKAIAHAEAKQLARASKPLSNSSRTRQQIQINQRMPEKCQHMVRAARLTMQVVAPPPLIVEPKHLPQLQMGKLMIGAWTSGAWWMSTTATPSFAECPTH
jgi:hypothetical protein